VKTEKLRKPVGGDWALAWLIQVTRKMAINWDIGGQIRTLIGI